MKKPAAPSNKFAIITTTINVPHLLKAYIQDAIKHKRDLVEVIVVGDRKTPEATATFCKELELKFKIPCRFISVPEQEAYMKRFGALADFIPWNCIQRRNVGLLMAYDGKADIIVTIDDDNFLSDKDYLGHHDHVGSTTEMPVVKMKTGWWNICEMLVMPPDDFPFYHRGYPLSKRWIEGKNKPVFKKKKVRVMVNAGLWLDEPDIDALTRLYFPSRLVRTSKSYKKRVALDVGTWSPFNSQNTALHRDVIPAYLLFPHVGRYDDIWASYVVRRISDHLGDLVSYGAPLVRQERNPHNYFKDFDAERLGLECNDVLLNALHACKLTARDYKGAFAEIAAQFPEAIRKASEEGKQDPVKFDNVAQGMKLWTAAFAGR